MYLIFIGIKLVNVLNLIKSYYNILKMYFCDELVFFEIWYVIRVMVEIYRL